MEPVIPRDFDEEHPELLEAITLHVVEMLDDNIRDFEHIIRATIKHYAISWTLCQRTLRRIINVLEEAELEQTKETVDHMKHCLISLCSSRAWPFLLHHQPPTHGRFDLAQIEEDFDHALIEPTQPEIPHPCAKERIFLHVFSGRRREGDLQFFMEKLYDQLCADGTTLCVVSLDLIIDQQWGNVRQETTQTFWLEGVRAGWVCGALCGPPCETWSQARFVDAATDQQPLPRHGPRPLRDIFEL